MNADRQSESPRTIKWKCHLLEITRRTDSQEKKMLVTQPSS